MPTIRLVNYYFCHMSGADYSISVLFLLHVPIRCPLFYIIIISVTYQVPTIAVIGSGGGFRAMVGLSGVVKALHDSGILQCSTYICGLSGSSW